MYKYCFFFVSYVGYFYDEKPSSFAKHMLFRRAKTTYISFGRDISLLWNYNNKKEFPSLLLTTGMA